MIGWNGFGRSLLFAAVAALAVLGATMLAGPLLGAGTVVVLSITSLAVVYVTGIAPGLRSGIVAGALASGLGLLLLLLPLGVAGTAAGAAGIVAVCRSGWLYRARPLRSIAIETALLVGGLALAHFLATGGLVSVALAVWGYFLVQSLFFLVGGVEARASRTEADPFERARSQLEALLE